MKVCPCCKKKHKTSDDYCTDCGTYLVEEEENTKHYQFCPYCKKTYDNSYIYCPDCEIPLEEIKNTNSNLENEKKGHTQICSLCKKTYDNSYTDCPDCNFPLEYITEYVTTTNSENDNTSNNNYYNDNDKNKNTISKIFRIIAKITFFIGFIGGLFIFILKNTEAYSYLSSLKLIIFNEELSVKSILSELTPGSKFIEVISIWIHTFITGMFFMAIAEIIDLLQKIVDKNK